MTTPSFTNLSTMAQHYLICALWAGTGDDGEPLDSVYDLTDCSPELLAKAEEDCQAFLRMAHTLDTDDWTHEQIGHDFLLTRCGHGCGFWSRDLGSEFIRERLTEIAHSFGSFDVYVGDDGRLYGS